MAHVITFGTGRVLRYLGLADVPAGGSQGWRPVIWTADRQRAEIFGSVHAADEFGRINIPHGAWNICAAPPMRRPGGDDPDGTPVQIAAAA